MINLENEIVDYSLVLDKYIEYYSDSCVLPVKEDDFYLYFAVCKNSYLLDINDKFDKALKFIESNENDIKFILSSIKKRKNLFILYKYLFKEQKTLMEDFFYELLKYSVESRASDIHIENYKNKLLLRLRVDGKLRTFLTLDDDFYNSICSYVKLLCNLDITLKRLPQDGRFSKKINSKIFDFRVSFMPTINNESLVLRVLDKKNINKSLNNLGFSSVNLNLIKEAINLKQGLVLLAGPTGSGKTTSLYSIIKEFDCKEKKIITIEDPIEYKIDYINQINVNSKIGLSFDSVLRNILRQDPDIIFIGEIRDQISLNLALQASLTGHLVLASVHSNSALDTISRLYDLDADKFLLSSSLKYIISQRLVLTYCDCNKVGCSKCNYSLFYGREVISEIIKVDNSLSSMIFKKSNINEMKKYLLESGFIDIFKDGKNKVEKGRTSLEEVYKVVNFQ